ncbi:hypothetical protein AJ79_09498 [Helicocarpus griseus UAMH5409]|uniref:Methyltransferase domain-containing protein n=1 Tax=Helicocarpus griseus UAMH5409 TaxID=1447875 RepID=A0A2B7WJH6_9EURO|nr:hypothetical protein AJ79_09498 [Helicocarpus griseus UAMH5409]
MLYRGVEVNPAVSVRHVHNETDEDSTFGDTDGQSATISLASSMMSHIYENGRRYHSFRAGSYFFPNDELEQERLDIIHHMTDLVLSGRLYLAPIGNNPQRILDLATGTGIWAIDMGDKFPSAEVFGNDLSPIQPAMIPPNVRFEIDDIEDDWSYKMPFDFIHCRYMATSISNWPRLVTQAYQNLIPGGWVEFCDYDFQYRSDDGSLTPELPMVHNQRLVVESSRLLGREPSPGPKLKKWVQDAGFINVTEKCYPIPIGVWAKDKKLKTIGWWNRLQFLQGVEAWSMNLLTHVLGWKPEEVQVHVAYARKDAQNIHIHAYYNIYVVYGQRPDAGAWTAPI